MYDAEYSSLIRTSISLLILMTEELHKSEEGDNPQREVKPFVYLISLLLLEFHIILAAATD